MRVSNIISVPFVAAVKTSQKGRLAVKKVDPKKLSDKAAIFQWNLDDKIIGQERALKHLLRAYQIFSVKLNPPNRPILVLLFCGPTGVGKTECVKALAATLLGNEAAFTRIDCAEFQRSHEVSKLMGAPPSYLGYNDHGSVRLSQDAIDKFQTEGTKINIILFDEIEKAHPDFHQVLLGVLDNGKLRLGNGNETDFTKSIIVFTSNIGSHETAALINHAAIGFKGPQTDRDDLDQKIYTQTKEAAKKFFRPEFLNRIDHTIVFRSLSHASLKKILSIELRSFQKRLFAAGHRISVRVEPSARDFLLREGTRDRKSVV